jgi:hypothetical protein
MLCARTVSSTTSTTSGAFAGAGGSAARVGKAGVVAAR